MKIVRDDRSKGSDVIKNIANVITILRIVFGVAMLFTVPFSVIFWVCYLCGGLSDILDGMIARLLKQQSEAGAKLDSIADLIFGLALSIVIIVNIHLPTWVWSCIIFIAALRFVSYGIGAYKYHTFSSLHTYANKIVGMLLFAFPLLYKILALNITGVFLCSIAFVSAIEEMIITIQSKELNRSCKGLLFR